MAAPVNSEDTDNTGAFDDTSETDTRHSTEEFSLRLSTHYLKGTRFVIPGTRFVILRSGDDDWHSRTDEQFEATLKTTAIQKHFFFSKKVSGFWRSAQRKRRMAWEEVGGGRIFFQTRTLSDIRWWSDCGSMTQFGVVEEKKKGPKGSSGVKRTSRCRWGRASWSLAETRASTEPASARRSGL